MSVEIDNDSQYQRPKDKCPKCNILLNERTVLHNVPENCKKIITYPFMKIGESMHLECYIQHVIDSYLEKKIKERK